MLTTQTDRELVEAVVVNGDERAFRELYRRHTPRLYQLVLRLTGSEHDAEDVVQEAWIRASEAAGQFRWESGFNTWLTGIAINRFKELLRKRNRWPAMALDQVAEPEVRPDKVGERVDLQRALELLPVGYRTVLVLTIWKVTGTRRSPSSWASPRARQRANCSTRAVVCVHCWNRQRSHERRIR